MMVDPELDELKREFLTEAREKVEEMDSTFRAGRSPQALERLIYLAHQLKGSGGSYGFQRISTNAAELEKIVERVVKGDSPSDADEQIRQHVTNLRGEIDRGVSELNPATS